MVKKLSLISLFTLLPASFYYAQTTVFAYVKDAQGAPVEDVQVDLKENSKEVATDKIGYFQFVDLKPGHYQVVISKPTFETKIFDFDVANEKRKDLGVLNLYQVLNNADLGVTVVDGSSSNTDEEGGNQTSTVGLLNSSRDVFSSIASYGLGAYWFRPRGIDSRTGLTMMNGVTMASGDDGNVDYGNWGGLNEITRYPEIANNHAPSEYAFGGIGSVIYKNTIASDYRKGSQLTYSVTNRNYRNRLSYRYSSGMSKNGWAVTAMAARRWAQEGIQEGTFYDGWGAFLGIEKKVNDHHDLTLNLIGAPYKRSGASPNTQEVYDFRGIHYNAYWGWQGGDKRSERVKHGFMPIIQLSDYWTINKKSSLWTTLSYQFGKEYSSRLDWYKANNPSPIYYRNLPSFFQNRVATTIAGGKIPAPNDQANIDYLANAWENNDQNITQLNWDNLYLANRNLKNSSQADAGRAVYWLADDVHSDKIWNAATHYTYNFNDVTKFILNLSYQNYYSEQYRRVNDLLGADYALNQDQYAYQSTGSSFNTLDANTQKVVGDKIGYDYILRRQEAHVNPGLKFSTGSFDVFTSALLGYTTGSREGLFKHYLYPNSYGKSADKNFWEYGLKGQVTYRINGRNFLVYNGAAYSQSPYLDDVFVNARVSNAAPKIGTTFTTANDLSYVVNSPVVKVRLTGYVYTVENQTDVQRFYADLNQGTATSQSAFVTQILSGISKRNLGAELGLQYKITPTLTASGLASYGQFIYSNNPQLRFIADNPSFYDGATVNDYSTYSKNMGTAYIKNYKQGGTPQEAYSVGLRYSSPKYWWIGANWNYLGNSYLDPSPATRTKIFTQNPVSGVPFGGVSADELHRILRQYKLPSAYFFDASAGKSWILSHKYYLMISATVNNILNNKSYVTGGFEQTRNLNYPDYVADYDSGHMNFAPKLWMNQGRSYFVNLQVRF